jgi:hypothetical protein
MCSPPLAHSGPMARLPRCTTQASKRNVWRASDSQGGFTLRYDTGKIHWWSHMCSILSSIKSCSPRPCPLLLMGGLMMRTDCCFLRRPTFLATRLTSVADIRACSAALFVPLTLYYVTLHRRRNDSPIPSLQKSGHHTERPSQEQVSRPALSSQMVAFLNAIFPLSASSECKLSCYHIGAANFAGRLTCAHNTELPCYLWTCQIKFHSFKLGFESSQFESLFGLAGLHLLRGEDISPICWPNTRHCSYLQEGTSEGSLEPRPGGSSRGGESSSHTIIA